MLCGASVNDFHSCLQVFAATSSSKLLWYIPVQEFKDISMQDKTLKLVSYLGPVTTSFEGDFSMTKQEMTFSFQHLVVSAWSRNIVRRSINFAKKRYRYFHVDDKMACARSAGTGLVVLKRC